MLCGRDPARGKKTERLREWSRECRRECFGGGFVEEVDDDEKEELSGAETDGYIGEVVGKAWVVGEAELGMEVESGEGSGGEKGLDIERVREWELEWEWE